MTIYISYSPSKFIGLNQQEVIFEQKLNKSYISIKIVHTVIFYKYNLVTKIIYKHPKIKVSTVASS